MVVFQFSYVDSKQMVHVVELGPWHSVKVNNIWENFDYPMDILKQK